MAKIGIAVGPNQQLAAEVVETFNPWRIYEGIFEGKFPIDPTPYEVIEDRRLAGRLAWRGDAIIWEGYTIWRQLIDGEASPAHFPREPVVRNYEWVEHFITGRSEEFRRCLTHLIGPKADKEILANHTFEDIAISVGMDYMQIALNRIQFGATREPFETMFSAYKQGGWPCGWKGEYPQGRMVVYHIGPKL